jgi:toxin ParE1/3/4
MKVVYTDAALRDLDDIADWLAVHYPSIAPAVEQRIRTLVAHIGRWPESAPRSTKRAGVRVLTVGRYPYKIFYRVTESAVEILHIHHAARQPWDEEP